MLESLVTALTFTIDLTLTLSMLNFKRAPPSNLTQTFTAIIRGILNIGSIYTFNEFYFDIELEKPVSSKLAFECKLIA